jgi:hypothetical protein
MLTQQPIVQLWNKHDITAAYAAAAATTTTTTTNNNNNNNSNNGKWLFVIDAIFMKSNRQICNDLCFFLICCFGFKHCSLELTLKSVWIGSNQTHIQWAPGVKRSGRDANHSSPLSPEAEKYWDNSFTRRPLLHLDYSSNRFYFTFRQEISQILAETVVSNLVSVIPQELCLGFSQRVK